MWRKMENSLYFLDFSYYGGASAVYSLIFSFYESRNYSPCVRI